MSEQHSSPDHSGRDRPTVVPGRGEAEYPRLEVFDDRIRSHYDPVRGQEWFKADGDRVLLVRGEHDTVAYVGSRAGTGIDVGFFDVARVREALLAHGWSWEADGRVIEPASRPVTESFAPAEPRAELVLKPHKEILDSAKLMRLAARLWLTLAAVVLALGLATAAVWLGTVAFFVVLGVVVGVPLLVLCVRAVRHTGLAVTITRDRIVVRTGSNTETVERARLIGPAKVDNFGVKFKVGKSFRDEVTVLAGRRNLHREELLAQLNAFGWPLEYT